ncbi:MAG TPA: dienelactone hydrolase family protein, partial [Sphingomicrobium sp.]|nr:dienelactone hydrolase family protein [Sphingomicrobium sp.]
SAFDHSDTAIALAEQGFIIAAPVHPGDNSQDASDVGKPRWLMNRSRTVSRTIDAVLHAWAGRRHVDPARVGVFGFSVGGTTALISVGGKPNLRLVRTHCANHVEFVCGVISSSSDGPPVRNRWSGDRRITAAVIAAPALGFSFDPTGLSAVHAPIQLWAAGADQTVPNATNTALVQRLLPSRPEVHVVPLAPHIAFVMPCGLVGQRDSCPTDRKFDRRHFHQAFNAGVVRFFRQHLQATQAS